MDHSSSRTACNFPVEIYFQVIANLSDSRSTLLSLTTTSKFLSREVYRTLYDQIALRLCVEGACYDAHCRFITSLPTHPGAHLIHTLEVEGLPMRNLPEETLNAALCAMPQLKVLLFPESDLKALDMLKVMQSVKFTLNRLQCFGWELNGETINMFSSSFGSAIADLEVTWCTVRPGEATLPRLQTLSVHYSTEEAFELASLRRVRRLCVSPMGCDQCLKWDGFDLACIESLSLGTDASMDDFPTSNIRYAHVVFLPAVDVFHRFPYVEHLVADTLRPSMSDVDPEDKDSTQREYVDHQLELVQELFQSSPRLRIVDLYIYEEARLFWRQQKPTRWRYSCSGSTLEGVRTVIVLEKSYDVWRTFPLQ